jgi:hypothetical protein
MRTSGLKKFRWGFFALAIIGVLETPVRLASAIPEVIADHRVIFPFVLAFAIRFLLIGWLLKVWWDTRGNVDPNPEGSNPRD